MARTIVKGPLAFTAADTTGLETYDASFVEVSALGAGFITIQGNKLTHRYGAGSAFIYRDGTPTYSADQYASAVLSFAGTLNVVRYGVTVRVSADTGAGQDWYAVTVDDVTSPRATRVYKCVNGTVTTLDSRTSVTWTNGDTIELESITNGGACDLKVYQNGVLLYTISDASSPLTSGKPGFYLYDTGGGVATFDNAEFGDVTASTPVLTSPTGSATGNTTANAGATIDAVSGSGSRIMYALPRIGGSAASSATIIATGTQLAVTTAGAKSVPLTGLTNGASYSADIVYVDATTGTSNVVTSSWTQPTAPVLSSPTNTPGSTTALIGATSTVSSGTAYYLARVGGSAALDTTIIATGQTSTVSTTTPSRTVTGLTASTANNYVDIVQVSGVTTSNVVSTAAFTTTASGDTTPPTLTGSIVIGAVTSSSIQFSWPAGSDNVAVTSYEVSSNGGSGYVDAGNVLTYTFTGLTASTPYGLRVRAKDAAGNVSTPALAATQSTAAASGVGSISLNNAALYTFRKNNGSIIVSTGVTFFVSNVTTGALIGSAITGLSTNAQGLVTTAISNASMLAGTTYRLSYEFSSGEYGSVKLPAV